MAFINGQEVLFSPFPNNVSGSLDIDKNGLYNVAEFESVNVKVEGESGGGGNAEFNIAYGETEPTDTSKLWVKTSEPEAVRVVAKVEAASEELEAGVGAIPTAAYNIAAAAVGKKVYLFGGYGDSALNTIKVFDTESKTITTLSTTLPTEAYGIASAAVGTKIYLFGGYGSSKLNTINVFDTENNTITTLSTTLPSARFYMAAAAVGTKIYLFGGSNGSGSFDKILVFDTESGTITTLSTKLPTAEYSTASAVIGTKIYLFGGWGIGVSLDTIKVFDTENNTITTLSTTLPTAAYGIASAAVGTKIYLFGGSTSTTASGIRLNTIKVFDTESGTITTLSTTLPTAAYNIAAAAVGKKVYLFGGSTGSGKLDTINVFVCALALALAANNILIEASTTNNIFNLLPTVELGVNAVYLGNADGVAETVAAALYVDGAWTEI